MNTYKPEEQTLAKALEALHNTTGIDAEINARELRLGIGTYEEAEVILKPEGQPHHFFIAEVKRVDRFVQLTHYIYRFGEHADNRLLVAPRITEEMADKCKELDLQFIDTIGNAYLKRPGLFVFIKGQRPNETFKLDRPEGKRAVTPTNLRVVFTLLCKPALLNGTYRDIKDAAEVALGTIGWVFFDLDERGYTVGDKNKRVLLERQKLIQEWVTNYPIKLRPKLNVKKFRAIDPDWWHKLDVKQYDAQWGAEVAAAKLTGYLRPQTCTIYFHGNEKQKNITKMVVENKLKADPFGDIELIDAFWDFKDEQLAETVPPILIYADLLATLDPRNFDTAKIINEKYIANKYDETE